MCLHFSHHQKEKISYQLGQFRRKGTFKKSRIPQENWFPSLESRQENQDQETNIKMPIMQRDWKEKLDEELHKLQATFSL